MAQRIGDFLMSIGMMSPQQVERVLDTQRSGDKRTFGEIAVALGFADDNSLRRFADYLDKHQETVT